MSRSMKDIVVALSEKYHGDFIKMYTALAKRERLTDHEINHYLSQVDRCLTTVLSDDYPNVLKKMNCPPFVIYYEGNLNLIDEHVEILAHPHDHTKRFFFNLGFDEDGIDYLIGCENREDLDLLIDYLIDQHPELNFKDYQEKEYEETLS